MKITTINIDNFKGIQSLHKDIKGNVIYVSGKNGSGKTSLLEAIYVALAKTNLPEKAIKEGETKAVINLTLAGKDVELEITRTITEKSNSLTIKENGKQVKNCRELLDGLLSNISIDPFKFMHMKEKEQAEIMAKVCGIDFDFEDYDTRLDDAVLERQALKRDVQQLTNSRDSIVIPADVPEQEFDIGKLNENLMNATTHNMEIQAKIDAKARAIARLNELKEEYNKLLVIAKEEFDETLQDTDDLKNQIKIANDYSSIRADISRKKQYADDLATKVTDLANQEKAIKVLEKTKDSAMSSFKSPVKGLKTDGKKLYLGDAPYSQASSAERIEVSAKLSMLANKEIKIVNIKDASLLDDAMLETISKVATEHDCQVFLEVVNNNEEVELTFEEVKKGETKASQVSVENTAKSLVPAVNPPIAMEELEKATDTTNYPDGFTVNDMVVTDGEGNVITEGTEYSIIDEDATIINDITDTSNEPEEYIPDEFDGDPEDFFGDLEDL